MNNPALFPLLYAGHIAYYAALKAQPRHSFDQHEHYVKQTYRSRCSIYGANGKLDLIIPVEKGKQGHRPVKDVKISYAERWQRIHWKSLESAYRTSPYFEYYEHHLVPFYEKKTEYLADFNVELTQKLMSLLEIEGDVRLSESYIEKTEGMEDLRVLADVNYGPGNSLKPYTQVFENKNGFIPNLSVFDLLFNCGPHSVQYL